MGKKNFLYHDDCDDEDKIKFNEKWYKWWFMIRMGITFKWRWLIGNGNWLCDDADDDNDDDDVNGDDDVNCDDDDDLQL